MLQYKTVAPVGDRVLVKIDVSEEKSVGGILLPTSAQKKPTQGHVEKAGSAKAVRVSLCALLMQHCLSGTSHPGCPCGCMQDMCRLHISIEMHVKSALK